MIGFTIAVIPAYGEGDRPFAYDVCAIDSAGRVRKIIAEYKTREEANDRARQETDARRDEQREGE